MLMQSQLSHSVITQQLDIIPMAVYAVHPVMLPIGETLCGLAFIAIIDKRLMIAIIISRYGRRMSSPGAVNDGAHPETGGDDTIRIPADDFR
jgi:hypothetical protein